MQTITIELRVDFDTCNKNIKEPIMLEMSQRMARDWYTQACLISDKRTPQIKIECGDFFSTTEEIKLINPED